MDGSFYSSSNNECKYYYRYACALVLSIIATCIFFYKWYQFVTVHNNTRWLLGLGNLGMAAGIYWVLYLLIGRWLHAFKIGVERKASVIASQFLTLLSVDFFELFISCAITGQFRYFILFLRIYAIVFLVQTVINCALTIPMINLYRHVFPPLQIVEIVGTHHNMLIEKINEVPYKYHIAEIIKSDESADIIEKAIKQYDAVLVNDISAEHKNEILKKCYEYNRRVYYVPKISDVLVKASEELNLFDTPLFLNRNSGMSKRQEYVKRLFDLLLSSVAIIVLSPIMIITALCIYLEDRGPVLYKQERVTLNGKRFEILKFRSMIVDAEKDGRPHPAGEKDDRITKVGHIIRGCRIDELPQLFNILKGDMSIVGPRPERVEHVEQYCREIPEFAFRQKVKGGLTGYAQVYGKYNTTALDKLKLDLLYITNYSLLLDLQIIFQTLKILFQKESTEGFSQEVVDKIHDSE